MGLLGNMKDSAANLFLGSDTALNLVNGYTGRYAQVKGIRKNGDVFEFTVQPNGSAEIVSVRASQLSVADDNSGIAINSISASMPWVDHALKDFVQGRTFEIPEAGRSVVGTIKSFL